MKKKLSIRETIVVASTLFGMFFGAGNLIFPVHLGQMAGSQVWGATLGFIVTAVGIPILGVAALGITRSDDMLTLSSKVSRGYGYALTCALYLTIGPAFAIPRLRGGRVPAAGQRLRRPGPADLHGCVFRGSAVFLPAAQ